MKIHLLFVLIVLSFPLRSQTPQVPHKLQFAGMTLTIHDDARREIQKDVDALTQSPKHFNMRVERAKTYFPVIEQVFEEEDVPADFKYLVLQESALIPDAVSTSNAVGFWQFKDFTALEMGLRVDKEIDERMNIVSSTRAAARYIKKNNTHFDNWLFALQAYQMGAGGVMQKENNLHEGASHMDITSKTYWYVKKYLAHKVAFEAAVNGPGLTRITFYQCDGKLTLKDVCTNHNVAEEDLLNYNKWIKKGSIPTDRNYVVVVPVAGGASLDESAILLTSAKTTLPQEQVRAGDKQPATTLDETRKINSVPAIKARPGETAAALSKRANLELNTFLKYNDMTLRDKVRAGEFYFTAKKRSRAEEAYHKVEAGDDLWLISQRHGVKLSRLRKFNRMDEHASIQPGTTVYLSSTRPRNNEAPTVQTDVVQVDSKETFNWEAAPTAAAVVLIDSTKNEQQPLAVEVASTPVQEPEVLAPVATPTVDSTVTVVPPSSEEVKVPIDTLSLQHIVVAGETLYGISKKYDVGVMQIVELNDLNLQEGIHPGQILKLRTLVAPEVAVKEKEIIHVVKPSDTLYSVARKYGVTIKQLMDWNAKSDFSISVGEKLRVLQQDMN